MPLYTYKANTSQNQLKTGSLTATTQAEAAQILTKQGLQPISISAKDTQGKKSGTLPPIEKITFCHYMATMINAGLSISEGISVMQEETNNALMKQILNDLLYQLEQGQSLSHVFALYPKAFDKFFITLVRAGEVSGTLSDSFVYLEDQLRAEYSLSQKIKSALLYPAIVFLAMLGIGFLMLFVILPQIAKVFLNMSLPLPGYTRFMFEFSLKLAQIRIPFVIVTLFLLIGGAIFIRRPAGKKIILKLITPVPIVKHLINQVDLARFCRTFSTLMASAVPVTEALEISLKSLSMPKYEQAANPIIQEVTQGKTMAAAFSQYQVFPSLITQMIAAGEKSGTLDKALADLAAFYDEEVTEAVKKSTQMLEPILMLVVGIGVGGMILSIIAPLYSVVGNLQQVSQQR